MHGPINVKSPNNISNWQMGFNSAFKGLKMEGKRLLFDSPTYMRASPHVTCVFGHILNSFILLKYLGLLSLEWL
jgi:hypothetical protein